MAVAVSPRVIGDGTPAIAASRNDRDDRGVAQQRAQAFGVVSLVCQDVSRTGQARWQGRRSFHVGHVSSGQVKREGPADNIGQSMDFAGLPAT